MEVLPRLKTSIEICRRRDSLSSARTRDSGYNSDLEISQSPLEFVNSDQDIYFAQLPSVPEVPRKRKSLLCSKYADLNKTSQHHHSRITSCPTSLATRFLDVPPEIGAFGAHKANIDTLYSTRNTKNTDLASQDEDIEKWIKDNLPSQNRPRERVSSITSLSSTSSCDMYSTTDDISDEEYEGGGVAQQSLIPISTLKAVKLILRKIEVNLRYAAYRKCTGSSGSSSNSNRSAMVSQESGRKASQKSGQKRKSRLEGSPTPEEDDGEEEGPNKRRRGSATTTDGSETGARFACPFYKHDPDRYRNRRTCPGPGWPTVHRMKEHLYRSHAQPIFCPICYSTFKSDKEQSNHIRLQQCQRSGPQQIEGIDRETVWTLRKRTTALRLEEDKWRDVYHVLFPEVPTPDIPSPFYDCDSPSEASRRFRRELLRRVQDELFTIAGQTPGSVEQQLLRQVADIIRRCERELLQPQEAPSMDTFPPERRASSSSMTSAGSLLSTLNPANPRQRMSHLSPTRTEAQEPCHLEVPQYGSSVNEPAVNFEPVVWGEDTFMTFEGLNWDAVFPSVAPDVSVEGELFTAMSAPMYT